LVRGSSGRLREPELSGAMYDPLAPLADRLERFDQLPYHLWDMKLPSTIPPSVISDTLLTLHRSRHLLDGYLPQLLPTLGRLSPLGLTFDLRLACAAAVASARPSLLTANASSPTLVRHLRTLCRPELS